MPSYKKHEQTSLISSTASSALTQSLYDEPLRILFVKPFQIQPTLFHSPPLGIISLVATLREKFKEKIEIKIVDFKLARKESKNIIEILNSFKPDAVGVSALNCEAKSAHQIAELCKTHNPNIITVLGGPYALKRSEEILNNSQFDWIFNGAADRTLPQAIERLMHNIPLNNDIPGLSHRDGSLITINNQQDTFDDLDSLPLPAWDLIDFDAYSAVPNMSGFLKAKRYTTLFTSRGCPYLCDYCHDLFSKKFTWRSVDKVIEEIALLHETYGVDEFQIVDDIFNLHKPRLREIMYEVNRRWPGEIYFNFPNGLRGDILDNEDLDALVAGGTYAISIAVETATPRLQELVEKHLDIEKTTQLIEEVDKRGIMAIGFFMLGFPTETKKEIQATIDIALNSRLTRALFFTVIPQPATPLYDLAKAENEDALKISVKNDEEGSSYYTQLSWYQLAYGVDLGKVIRRANWQFYLSPKRLLLHILRTPHPFLSIPKAALRFLMEFQKKRSTNTP